MRLASPGAPPSSLKDRGFPPPPTAGGSGVSSQTLTALPLGLLSSPSPPPHLAGLCTWGAPCLFRVLALPAPYTFQDHFENAGMTHQV